MYIKINFIVRKLNVFIFVCLLGLGSCKIKEVGVDYSTGDLTGDSPSGKTWKLTKLLVSGADYPMTDCLKSERFIFIKNGNATRTSTKQINSCNFSDQNGSWSAVKRKLIFSTNNSFVQYEVVLINENELVLRGNRTLGPTRYEGVEETWSKE